MENNIAFNNNRLLRSFNTLLRTQKVERSSLLNYGFEEVSGVYTCEIPFVNGDYNLVLTIDSDLSFIDEKIVSTNGRIVLEGLDDLVKVYQDTSSLPIRYREMLGIRNFDGVFMEYDAFYEEFKNSCTVSKDATCLYPDQVKALEEQLSSYEIELGELGEEKHALQEDGNYKASDNFGGTSVADVGSQVERELYLDNEIIGLINMLENHYEPNPSGEEVITGSLVRYSNIGTGKDFYVWVIDGPRNVSTIDGMKTCPITSPVGKELMGCKRGDIIEVNGNALIVEDVDNGAYSFRHEGFVDSSVPTRGYCLK